MRKFKSVVAGQVSVYGKRPVIRPLDDGILAVPIAQEERDQAHQEMREFMKRHNEQERSST